MQNFNLNSTIRFGDKEYQLITSNNGQDNKIICSLFRNGEFINSKETNYEKEKKGNLHKLVQRFHHQRETEIEQIFKVSKKLNTQNNPELQNMLGLVFARNNLHAEAVREFRKVIDKNPHDSWAYDNLGKAFLSLKKHDAALKAFHRAIELNPNYADLYNNCGFAYFETGKCKVAVEHFNKAIELNPYYAEAYFNQGLALILNQINNNDFDLKRDYPETVLQIFDKARLINPSYFNSSYHQGIKFIRSNDAEKALQNLKLAKYKGNHTDYGYDKHEFYLKLMFLNENKYFETIWKYIKFLQELLKKSPHHADLYNDLGLAYCILRNFINDKAIESFRTALDINPNFEKAKRNFKLTSYEKTGSALFLKALTSLRSRNGNQNAGLKFEIRDSYEAEPITSTNIKISK